MSDIELFDVNDSKINSPKEKRRSSAVSFWGDSQAQNKEDIPVHLFISPTHSNSLHSSSSASSRIKDKKYKTQTQETSFETNINGQKIFSLTGKGNVEADSPVPGESEFSSDSEYVSSGREKTKKQHKIKGKSKATLRTNKVHDYKTHEENRQLHINESEKRSRLLRVERITERRSSSIGDSSTEAEIKKSITPKSEVSYRERIRDRFHIMKERAVESLSRPQSRSQSRLKSLMMTKQEGFRVEDLLKQEEDRISAAMERHKKIKSRWQQIAKASLEYEPKSVEDSINFFIDGKSEISPDQSVTPEEITSLPEPESSADHREDSKILASEFLGIREDWDLVEYVKPQKTNEKNKKLWEERLFYPSTKPVSLENKIEPGLTPRFTEKEGLYVGTKIKIPPRMKNKMEQRILKTPEGRKWFGKDGDLISSTNPLKPVPTRPYFDEDADVTSAQFKPAMEDHHHRYMDLSGNLNYVLDIDVNSIDFTHHPLFSREHVLAQRLKDLYTKYKRSKEADNLNRLTGRLNALRRTRDNLKNLINQSGDNKHFDKKLEKYENDIAEVRQLRYIEGQINKQLTNKIIMTWKDLLKLREEQGYQSTSIKLGIKKKVTEDLEKEQEQWEDDLKEDTKEILRELKKEHKQALEEYKEKHEIWSQKNKKQTKPTEKGDEMTENMSDTESVSGSESEQDVFVEEEPKPPKPLPIAEVKTKVLENFKESFRRPGEPEVEFVMSKGTNIDVSLYNNKEELRRSAVKRCMIFIKLFYNGKEVCRSKSLPLGQNFSVKISQRFAIRILELPESLMIEIHEETGSLNRNLLVPGIYLPIPDSFTAVHNSEIEKHEFSSKLSVTYHHAAVGSGCKITPCPDGSAFNNQPVCLYTSGTVSCRVGWVDEHGKILAPPEKYWCPKKKEPAMNVFEILRSGGAFDLTKLKEWAENSKLDPNDPYNSAFFHFLENSGDSEKSKPSYFRLNPLLDEFDFCQKTDIESNIRLKLLKLRDMGEPEFRNLKMIPLNEKQIHKEIFKDYEKRISTPYTLTDVLSSDPIDGHRTWGKKYLDQVQQKLLKQSRMARQRKRFQDIITEENIPDVGTLGLTFMKWLRPKRPLHPERKERKKVTPQNLSGEEINIVVNVVRAFEVPIRKDVDGMPGNENIEGFSLVNVRPFVEISFRGITARTTAAEGANPTWNQDLKIPIQSKNKYFSAGNLHSIKDTLYLHLFDEMIIDLIEDENVRETNIHQRLERHWLASMKIPFSTMCFNSRIEGTFKLYSPPVLLGYEREAHKRHFAGQEHTVPQRDATYLTLFVTVQPALNPPTPIKEKLESREVLSLEKHLQGWQQEINNMFPQRRVKTLVLDITGKSVCVTRFVKALKLPPMGEEEKITPEMAARFVAMIPCTEGAIFPGYFDIWLTSDQILSLLSGNYEDHAILLCSYFLQLGLQAYVLLGSGIPHGSMAYVLVKEKAEKNNLFYVWDPTNGQKYNVDDSFCPLQKIYCLINDQNIWANIQAEEMPRRTKFDLTKRADWFPAFGKNIAAPTGSIQPQYLNYTTTSRQAVDILRDKIEKKLRDNLMKWRKKNRTQWNRYCAATLRKLLPKLEESTWNLGQEHTPDHILELQHILASHKMCGFPINMPYTGIEAVSEAVKATGVHCNENESVEFALAVYIHSYPNDILSVWVYVASLIRRR